MNSVHKMNYNYNNYFNSLTLSQLTTLIYDSTGQLLLNWCTSWIVVGTCNSNAINIKLDWNVVIMIARKFCRCALWISVQCTVCALFNLTILNISEFSLFLLSSFCSVRYIVVDSFQRPVSIWMNWQKAEKKREENKRKKCIKDFKMPLELVSLRLVFGVFCSSFLGEIIWWVCATLTLFVNYSRR